jgi:saccharopine dehydrogenase-like NADP-dependent oxidoreductase
MGRYAVRAALTYDFVGEVVVADIDGDRAAAFAGECGPKATSAAVDVENGEALAGALSDADVVLNTVGPFYRLGVPVLRAAIEAGCHYLDINDDWEPTEEMLKLDEEARKTDITAIVGIGASPGVSNLLAVKAISQLDSVEDVMTGWGFGGGAAASEESGAASGQQPPQPSAALVHWMHQCSGKIRVLRDARFVDVPPLEEMMVEFPGVSVGTVWSVGHPEAVTLPRWRPDISNCFNVMFGPPRVIDAVRSIAAEIDAGRLTPDQGAQLLLTPPPREESTETGPDAPASQQPRLPPLFATANGLRQGKPTTAGAAVLAMPSGGMGGATGVPMAVALSLFADGKIGRRGVSTPETAIDPDTFFDALAPLCTPPRTGSDDMLLINTSG